MGKHNLSIQDEYGSVKHNVSKISIHPDWTTEGQRFDADISLVLLKNKVTFNLFVEPICLPKPWNGETFGIVPGWGQSEHSDALGEFVDSTLNELEMPIINTKHCFVDTPQLAFVGSKRTFCAGYFNQSKSVCFGDGGGGFYTVDKNSGLFSINGIVSSSLMTSTGCNKEVYSIFTDVIEFVDWIKTEMQEEQR